MRGVVRIGLCTALAILGPASWRVAPAGAEVSEACRDLAARFAAGSGQLDLKSLATLMTCVSGEIQDRVPGAGASPPPAAPEAPSPASQQPEASPSPAKAWGAWPAEAPWTILPPLTSPWDK